MSITAKLLYYALKLSGIKKKYTVRERSGMFRCYAMLPYFKEAKADYDEIARILTA